MWQGNMSKQIKQMQMDALKQTFGHVRDMVVLSVSGLTCQADNTLRLALRKKQVRLHMVKNSLARRVFGELGLQVGENSSYWKGNSILAWGLGSPAELSRAVQSELGELTKKNPGLKDKVVIKGGIADGQEVTFERMIKMPTRTEAIGRVVALALGPASRLASQILAPAAKVASQLKTLADRPAEPAPSEPAPAEPAPAG
jgi:large subunit ribosomal protein L10